VPPHPYGWLSILPPVAAIVLAIATRRVILSLLAGIFAGALVTTGGNPLMAVADTLEIHLWKTLAEEGKLRVFAFTLLMGAMVGVINRAGGMRGLVAVIAPLANNRRRGQLTTWLLGLVIFFDDYANTLLLGTTLRPLCDRLKISREKLAYLVDSTAAPVAGLALVSTWVAVEIEYVREGIDNVAGGAGIKAFDLFVRTIPYRFYVLWTLIFVPLVALMARDFGPMLRAERRWFRGDGVATAVGSAVHDPTAADDATPARWVNAVVPILVTVGAIVWLLYRTGSSALTASGATGAPPLRDIFGAAASSFALMWGCLAGLVTAALMAWVQRLLSGRQILAAAGVGARLMLPALVILWLASTLSRLTGNKPITGDEPAAMASLTEPSSSGVPAASVHAAVDPYPLPYRLYTGKFLGDLIGSSIAPWLLPTIIFVLASFVSLATGTSYGTMGILLPMVVPLVFGILAGRGPPVSPADPILLASIGGVLAGAIFGDHCSPISDTTILSSQASGCEHTAHVRTQMPYALLVATIAIVFGTLPVGLGVPVWLLLPIGVVAMVVALWALGRPVESDV
jgi:Na+/H+ antiporter NhaC